MSKYRNGLPVIIDGQRFKSIIEAARHFNVTDDAIVNNKRDFHKEHDVKILYTREIEELLDEDARTHNKWWELER